MASPNPKVDPMTQAFADAVEKATEATKAETAAKEAAAAATAMWAKVLSAASLAGMNEGLQRFRDSLKLNVRDLAGFGDRISRAAGGLSNALTAPFMQLKNAVSAVVSGLTSLPMSIKALGDQVGQFVGLANPAAMKQFTFAIEDTMAVIGVALTPVLEAITMVAKELGTVLLENKEALILLGQTLAEVVKAMLPMIGPIVNALLPVLQFLADALLMFAEFLQVMAPVLNAFGAAFKAIAEIAMAILKPVFEALGAVLKILVDIILGVVQLLYDALREIDKLNPFTDDMERRDFKAEFYGDKDKKDRPSATGMAVRSASISDNVSEIGRRTAMASLTSGGSASEKKDPQTVQLEMINQTLKDIKADMAKNGVNNDNASRFAAAVSGAEMANTLRRGKDSFGVVGAAVAGLGRFGNG